MMEARDKGEKVLRGSMGKNQQWISLLDLRLILTFTFFFQGHIIMPSIKMMSVKLEGVLRNIQRNVKREFEIWDRDMETH